MSYTQVFCAHPERREVYELIRANPGITTAEVHERLPHRSREEVYAAVRNMNGVLIRSRGRVPIKSGKSRVSSWEALR